MTTKEIDRAFDISNMIPNRVLKDDDDILKYIKHDVAINKVFLESFTVNKSVCDDIKSDLWFSGVNMTGDYHGVWVRYSDIEKIFDKHLRGNGNEDQHRY